MKSNLFLNRKGIRPLDLKKINPKKIFLDHDKDGIIDHIDLQLHLYPSCSDPTVLSAVMDLAACLGFETMGMNLPLGIIGRERDPSFHHHLYIGLNHELKEIDSKKKEEEFFLKGKDEESLIKSINDFAFSLLSRKATLQKRFSIIKDKKRVGFNLLNPFSNQGFYSKSFKNPLYIFSPYKILLFSNLKLNTAAETANFAARFGLESLSLSLPLTFPFEKKPRNAEHFVYIGKKEDLSKIGLQRFEDGFESYWESGIFLLPSKKKIPDVLICGEEKGLEDILKHLSYLFMNSKGADEPISYSINRYFEKLDRFISGEGLLKRNVIPKKVVKGYLIPDERKEILKLLKEGLQNWKTKSKSVDIQIFLTRPEKLRRKFVEEIHPWLKRSGIPKEKATVVVLNAYKPGLSWMKEIVLKEISGMKIDRIEIAFKAFRENGLEEPIRWLQEIYPIDEIFSRALSISKEKIKFKKDSRIKEIYRVRGWRKKGIVYDNHFSPKWVSQPYLPSFRRLGKINPCTGWVNIKVDGQEVVNQRIKTGTERIWEVYQTKILSLIKKEANRILSNSKKTPPYQLFQELRFDVYFNYPMESLGIDEERISPLEALHEDLYFVTLHFFPHWLKGKRLKGISLGRVLPVIHPRFKGKDGKMKFTLVHQSEETSSEPLKMNEVKISLNGMMFNQSEIGIDFFIHAEQEKKQEWLKERLRSWSDSRDGIFKMTKIFEGGKGVRFIAFGSNFKIRKKSQNIGIGIPIGIPMERAIGYREGVKLIKSLESLPGVKVIEEGCSSGGLPLFSIENTYPCPNTFISHAKRMVFRSTLFVNCRHHANEISSTNAGLKLSYLLATQPRFQPFLKKANVVINPMENVDGMVILEEMQKLTPTDKLHAARYDQAGQEYYIEYFNPRTPVQEAKIKPGIWERWLPDICVDNHGFPSHEWDQPFSGYAPFQFREWWIPRALFFIYLPHFEEKKRSSQRTHAEALSSWIVKNVSKWKTITKRNEAFLKRYWKYRGQWIKNYHYKTKYGIQCLPLQKQFRRINYSYQYPNITTIDFITEVADETAYGKFLRTCISAHLITNLEIIKLLNKYDFPVKKRCLKTRGETHFMWERERPLVFKKRGR